MRNGSRRRSVLAGVCVWGGFAFFASATSGQEKPVVVHISVEDGEKGKEPDASEVVVWLRPLDAAQIEAVHADPPAKRPQIVQKNKSFQPHLLVVRVGSVVDFPNRDPFFHNVFSLFDGKRFDLGLYEAGATNSVRFDHPGVSYLFCNIHPEMSAVVVAVDTPYYAISDKNGIANFRSIPDGRYDLHVWYERSVPEALKDLTRTVRVSAESRDLGTIKVPQDPGFTPTHKNKYGQDYAPPPKGYSQQP